MDQNFEQGIDFQLIREEINSISSRVQTIEKVRANAQDSLESYEEGTLQAAQRLELFKKFMDECKGASEESNENVKNCLDAWKDYSPLKQDTIFEVLAEKVPPGILLLFLLSTLDGLFRYNLRLSEFHHSRADALELIERKRDEKELEALGKFVDALAGDKVEFGKSNSPSEQAVDLAKTILNRKS